MILAWMCMGKKIVCGGCWVCGTLKKKKRDGENNNNMRLSIWTHGYLGLRWPFWNLCWSCPKWEWRVCFVEKIIKKKMGICWNNQIYVNWLEAWIRYVKWCCELCMMLNEYWLNEFDCRKLVRIHQLCLRHGEFHEQKKETSENEVSAVLCLQQAWLVVYCFCWGRILINDRIV